MSGHSEFAPIGSRNPPAPMPPTGKDTERRWLSRSFMASGPDGAVEGAVGEGFGEVFGQDGVGGVEVGGDATVVVEKACLAAQDETGGPGVGGRGVVVGDIGTRLLPPGLGGGGRGVFADAQEDAAEEVYNPREDATSSKLFC